MTQEKMLRWAALMRRNAMLIIAIALFGAVAGGYQAARSDGVTYVAKAVLFSQSQLPSASGSASQQVEGPTPFLRSQAQLATSQATLRRAATLLPKTSVPSLQARTSASVDSAADTLVISVRAESGSEAVDAANAVAQSLSSLGVEELAARLKVRTDDLQRQVDRMTATVNTISNQLEKARATGQDITTLQARRATATSQYATLVSSQQELLNQIALQRAPIALLEPASRATRVRDASVPLRELLGFGIGLLVAMIVLAIRQFLDDTVRRVEQAEAIVARPLLAELPYERLRKDETLPVLQRPNGGLAESFRGLRTALKFVDQAERLRSVAIISSEPGDGKTLTAANLAVSYAQAGSQVILVSADLRNPALDVLLKVSGSEGLADLLATEDATEPLDVRSRLQDTSVEGLRVLPAGTPRPNPSELLASARAEAVFSQLHGLCDIVVVDSPPLLVADPEILGGLVDGLVLVVSIDRTHVRRLQRAAARLAESPLRIVGLVVNRADARKGYYGPYGGPYPNQPTKSAGISPVATRTVNGSATPVVPETVASAATPASRH